MNYLDADNIVFDYESAMSLSKSVFRSGFIFGTNLRCKHDAETIFDAYIVYFGHMVLYNTCSKEEFNYHLRMLRFVPNILEHSVYEKYSNADKTANTIEKKGGLYKFFHEEEFKQADEIRKEMMVLMDECYKRFQAKTLEFDYGEFINNCVQKKREELQKNTGNDRRTFINDYIDFVYSKTRAGKAVDEDYAAFKPYDLMYACIRYSENLPAAAKKIYTSSKYVQQIKSIQQRVEMMALINKELGNYHRH